MLIMEWNIKYLHITFSTSRNINKIIFKISRFFPFILSATILELLVEQTSY